MSVVAGPVAGSRKAKLLELLEWIERSSVPMQVRVRPCCPVHRVPMVTRCTDGDTRRFYCPDSECTHGWKGNPDRGKF